MALRLTTEMPDGVAPNYWKVTGIRISRDAQPATVDVALYLSQEARKAGKQPVQVQTVLLPAAAFSSVAATVYDEIKKLPDFAGAVDV